MTFMQTHGFANEFLAPPVGLQPKPDIIIEVTPPPVVGSTPLDREFNTIYQNTSGKLMLVVISAFIIPDANNILRSITSKVDSFSPPTTNVAQTQIESSSAVDQEPEYTFCFLVPPDFFYVVEAATDINFGARKTAWTEYLIVTPIELTRNIFTNITRPLDTIFQNSSGQIRFVNCSFLHDTGSALPFWARSVGQIKSVSPPTDLVASNSCEAHTASYIEYTGGQQMQFVVPQNWFYRVATDIEPVASVSFLQWSEHTFSPPLFADVETFNSATRPFDTEFENKTGKPLIVVVSVDHDILVAQDRTMIIGKIGKEPTLATVCRAEVRATPPANTRMRGRNTIIFVVPIGFKYRVDTMITRSGNVTLISWVEYALTL